MYLTSLCLLTLVALSACSPAPKKLSAADIPYGEGTVQSALDKLAAPAATTAVAETADSPKLELLEERIGRLELLISEMQVKGIMPATSISFDPRLGTMSATNTQVALETLESRLAKLEDAASGSKMGEPGPGLFDLGKSSKGGKPGKPGAPPPAPPNASSGQGGPPEPPNQQGGQQQGGQQQGGQQQGGQGQSGGGKPPGR